MQRRIPASRRLLATRAAVSAIVLSTALTALSHGRSAPRAGWASVSHEPASRMLSNRIPGGSDFVPMSTGQQPKDLRQELERTPDIDIQIDNSSDAPLVIGAATIKAVKVSPVSDPKAPPNLYWISPDVLLRNATRERITGLVLQFAWSGSTVGQTWCGEGGLDLAPGAGYRLRMKPQWDAFPMRGDPNLVRVSVIAVLIEGKYLWVSGDRTGRRRPDGTQVTRADIGDSQVSSLSDAASSRPAPADQPEPPASVGPAKTVGDAAGIGYACSLTLVEAFAERIGLTVVFKESAEAYLKRIGALFLRSFCYGDLIEITLRLNNLEYTRTGDQLIVKLDKLGKALHRLILAN